MKYTMTVELVEPSEAGSFYQKSIFHKIPNKFKHNETFFKAMWRFFFVFYYFIKFFD